MTTAPKCAATKTDRRSAVKNTLPKNGKALRAARRASNGSKPAPTRTEKEVAVFVRIFLWEIVNKATEATVMDDALSQLSSIGHLIEHHPGLQREATALLRGTALIDQAIAELREFSDHENSAHLSPTLGSERMTT